MTQLPDDSNIKPPTEEVKEVQVEQIGMAHDVTSARGDVPVVRILIVALIVVLLLGCLGFAVAKRLLRGKKTHVHISSPQDANKSSVLTDF